jgi:3-deoxy-manno-octulosonate cytidylyltransferase (CMP-KDO synthetase)
VIPFVVHPYAREAQPAPVVIAVVPARYNSSRLPGKPLLAIAGRPLIQHVYERAARVAGIGRVIVATDDERIKAAVEAFGGEAVMTSPDHRSGTDRLAEVAARIPGDLVVNVQGDEPLIEPAMIAAALGPFVDSDVQMSTLRRRLDSRDEWRDPNVVKVVVDARGDALYFSRAPIPWGREAQENFASRDTFKHIGLYVYRREFLLRIAALPQTPLEHAEALEQLRVLEHGYRIRTVETTLDSIGVDTPADLARVREWFESAPAAVTPPTATTSA